MGRRDTSSKILDETLKVLVTGSAIGAGMILPNLLIALEKPLDTYLKSYEKREREREGKRIVYYMKEQGYLRGEYEHGLHITKKGRQRLEKLDFENLEVVNQARWDHLWRIIFYDIPEEHKAGRNALTAKLRALGFFQLQRSVWIHPFPCREVIETITNNYGLEKYVSYIESPHLDNETVLVNRFKKRIPTVSFQ